MNDYIFAFFTFSFVAAITPGPSNVMLMLAGVQAGFVRGLYCLCGVVAGMAMMMGSAKIGLGGVIQAYPEALMLLRYVGAAFLLWMAFKIATAPPVLIEQTSPMTIGFGRAFAFQWLNPKSWIVSVSAASAYNMTQESSLLVQAIWQAGLFALASAPSCAVWLAFGSMMQSALQNERQSRLFNRVMALMLALSIVFVIR